MTNRQKALSVYNAYEKNGQSSAFDEANKLGIKYEHCKPCESEMPQIDHICLVCGHDTEALPQTIKADTSPLVGVLFAIMGGKFLLRKDKTYGSIAVVDNDGNIIGSAHTSGNGYAIHTKNYGGYASLADIVFVDENLNPIQQ